MVEKYEPRANLTMVQSNPAASSANIRQPGGGGRKPMGISLPTPAALAGGGGSVFGAMMAVNQAQNQIFDKVLDGPVSQQTQRQLAQLQALNMKNSLADEIVDEKVGPQARSRTAEDESDEGPAPARTQKTLPSSGQTRPLGYARSLPLGAGRTIASGTDTGRIFSPAQLTAFKQRVGLNNNVPAALEAARNFLASAGETSDFESGALRLAAAAAGAARTPAADASASAAETEAAAEPGERTVSGEVEAIIKKVGEALGLDPSLIRAVIKTESNFNSRAVSPAGAKGLMQLMPGTAKDMGVKDPFNVLENIWGGARYLKQQLDNFGGNLDKALAAYNWGPGNFQRHGGGGKNMPRETRRYIEAVNRNYNRFKSQDAASA
ncbi:MAG: lytic transglycosylase domain-containing protein [Deltaproteobacteria bacterium]|nr:lytic transglycosylase domain-containing protein [Deltaproteobacteria bacterium]